MVAKKRPLLDAPKRQHGTPCMAPAYSPILMFLLGMPFVPNEGLPIVTWGRAGDTAMVKDRDKESKASSLFPVGRKWVELGIPPATPRSYIRINKTPQSRAVSSPVQVAHW